MKAFILLSIIAATFASQQCGENEHFEQCGTACPLTCENYRDPPKFCVLSCNSGCFCDEGFVRASDGRCVKPEQCPSQAVNQQCGENEHSEECGTACPLTCDNYRDPPRFCVLSCNSGCFCDKGYVRAGNGQCVKPDQCPSEAVNQKCGENEHFESCGTACPLTCDNYDNPPRFCVKSCGIGCHCDTGYVKTSDGRCVTPDQCPSQAVSQQCGENEHFESCGTACPLTCDNFDNPPRGCIKRCDIGCHCDTGYVRTSDGRCVKPDQCPSQAEPVCGENQRFQECGTACPLTCENYANPPEICVAMCVTGCHCEKGYVKTRDGRCVRPENCPSRRPPTVKTCTEKPETGMCMAYFPSWYYDTETGTCKKFVYGGCGGNGNRYKSEKKCLENCKGTEVQQSSSEDCDLPAETGVCRGSFPRFYFDRTTGQCQRFVYGGCGGNENNFETIEACQRSCAKAAPTACLEEKVTGPCKAYFTRWFFNKATEQCEEFVYGGCNANSNNFLSKEDCHAVCAE